MQDLGGAAIERERAHLAAARAALRRMRERVQELLGTGNGRRRRARC